MRHFAVGRLHSPFDTAFVCSHRPIGLGVQGLQDVFFLMRYPFESPEAAKLNTDIFETIYFAAVTTSNELAKVDGPYDSFPGSPASKGILQFDMWGVTVIGGLGGRWCCVVVCLLTLAASVGALELGRAQGICCQAWAAQLTLGCTHANRVHCANSGQR